MTSKNQYSQSRTAGNLNRPLSEMGGVNHLIIIFLKALI